MEPSPSSEANSRSATQEFPKILWNPKVYYRVHKSPPLILTLRQMNAAHTTPSNFSKTNFNIILHQRLGLPSGHFSCDFPTKTLYAFLSHACYTLGGVSFIIA
jgi:hypothetical protein